MAAVRCPFRKALGSSGSSSSVLPGMTAMAKHCPHLQAEGPAASAPALGRDGTPLADGVVRIPVAPLSVEADPAGESSLSPVADVSFRPALLPRRPPAALKPAPATGAS